METLLFNITITLLVVVTVINLVLPLAYLFRIARMEEKDRFAAIKRLYGLHYQRKNSLTSGKR